MVNGPRWSRGPVGLVAALTMLGDLPGTGGVTVGADKADDSAADAASSRKFNVTLHVAQNIDERRGSNRCQDHATSRLRGQSGGPATDRGSEPLSQGRGWNEWDSVRGLPRMA